jgi:hypothetical protein
LVVLHDLAYYYWLMSSFHDFPHPPHLQTYHYLLLTLLVVMILNTTQEKHISNNLCKEQLFLYLSCVIYLHMWRRRPVCLIHSLYVSIVSFLKSSPKSVNHDPPCSSVKTTYYLIVINLLRYAKNECTYFLVFLFNFK